MLLKARELRIRKELNVCTKNKTWKITKNDSLHWAIEKATNGDTLLIDDGYYALEHNTVFTDKILQVIGVGKDVTIELPDYHNHVLIERSRLYFKNVVLCTVFMSDRYDGFSRGLFVCSGSSLWIEDCQIVSHFAGISVDKDAHLCVTNSRFTGEIDPAITVDAQDVPRVHQQQSRHVSSSNQKVVILNCRFCDESGCRTDCTIIKLGDTVRIVGNNFHNVKGLRIGITGSNIPSIDDI